MQTQFLSLSLSILRGGVCVGRSLANLLNISMSVFYCRGESALGALLGVSENKIKPVNEPTDFEKTGVMRICRHM